MSQLTEYELNRLNKFGKSVMEGKWTNEGLIQLIESAGGFLNLQTIPDYSAKHCISYNGAKKFRTIRKIFNVKFVIDNH